MQTDGILGTANVEARAARSGEERSSLLSTVWSTSVGRAVGVAATWRLILLIWGVAAHWVIPPSKHLHALTHYHDSNVLRLALDTAVRNDGFWYARIVQHGYAYSTHHLSSIGFYPLYPLAIKGISLIVPDAYLAGTALSTLCLLGSAALLALWLEDHGGRRLVLPAVAILLCYPFAFFFSTMYAESLYLMLTLASFVSFERRRWVLTSVSVFLLVLCRPTGIVILPCLLLLAMSRRERLQKVALPLVSGVAGAAAFAVYQYLRFGTVLAYVHAKAVPPWSATVAQGLQDLLLRGRPGIPPWFLAFNLIIAMLVLACVPWIFRRLGPAYALFTGLSVVLSMDAGLPGMQRYVAVLFPVVAVVASTRKRKLLLAAVTVAFYLELLFLSFWVGGYGVF